MLLRFTKMHGLGNDFMVIDLVSQHAHIQPKHAKQWGDRHTGVGFDQLLIVEPPQNPDVDFRYRIFNSDGSGSGAMRQRRALLRPLRGRQAPDCQTQDQGGNQGRHHRAGHPPRWTDPRRHGPAAPGAGRDSVSGRTRSPELFARGGRAAGGIGRGIHGQPHAVLLVDSVERAPVHELGPKIEHHPRFPQRVNVGFLQVVDRRHARLRVWERGLARPRPAAPVPVRPR